jgi:hypothetical protein
MATDIVQGLFGMTPESYQQQRDAEAYKRAAAFGQMDPMQSARTSIFYGANQLGGAIGGMLGAEDPQLVRIRQQQQVLSGLDVNDPQSIAQAVKRASDMGNPQLALQLTALGDQAMERIGVQEERQLKMLARRQQLQAEQLIPQIQRPATPARIPQMDIQEVQQMEDQGTPPPEMIPAQAGGYDPEVLKRLIANAPGRATLASYIQAQSLTMPKYEKAGDGFYKLVPGQDPVFIGGVLKKGEKIAERSPAGGWTFTSPTSAEPQNAPGENPINALITGKAIHSSVIPYAQQLSRSWARLDPEDQDKIMKDLTTINNSAVTGEATRGMQATMNAGLQVSRDLQQQMIQLTIDKAKREQEQAKDGKPISETSLKTLSKQSDAVEKTGGLSSTFDPSYVGFVSDQLGKAAITIALRSSDPKSLAMGQWWQGYQEDINRIRNELFGAALTAGEKSEFDRAIVTPGMSAVQAQANLKKQAEQAQKAFNKITNVYRANGFSKSALDSLLPLNIDALAANSGNAPGNALGDIQAQAQAELAKRQAGGKKP